MSTILITGGSGLIGSALTAALQHDGHTVRWLSRSAGMRNGVQAFAWDVERGTVDPEALRGVDHIIHLAGAGIADKHWTAARKLELERSRAESARVLLRAVKANGAAPKSFTSAAGINYYGADTTAQVFTENEPPGKDHIAHLSRVWEEAADEWASTCRVVKLRTPLVLAREGGGLAKLALPARFGLGAPLGTGRQWMPWVHLDDLVRAYQHAIANEAMRGAYNVCASDQRTNRDFSRAVAQALHRPFFLPAVPGFLLKLALGELSSILLGGSRAANAKLLATGFAFRYDALDAALKDCLG
ncbi:MAG: TIGR01777 family oxidoreductase [Flavobacteriales bacterium]|nr:TIGR01777 family oxidoreductase [Flavobacteriales bacterium]